MDKGLSPANVAAVRLPFAATAVVLRLNAHGSFAMPGLQSHTVPVLSLAVVGTVTPAVPDEHPASVRAAARANALRSFRFPGFMRADVPCAPRPLRTGRFRAAIVRLFRQPGCIS